MAINTNYGAYQSYTSLLFNGTSSTAGTATKPDGTTKQTTAATTLRETVGVEVTLSPAALQALASYAASKTEDTEDAITAKMRAILDDIFISGVKEAQAAAKALPKDGDAVHKKIAQQATDYLSGKTDENPFAGKSLVDLASIVVDTTGRYTLNERRAAFTEFSFLDTSTLDKALSLETDAQKAAANAEMPKSNDPARIASAQAATSYVTAVTKDNPFAGKTRDELTAIIANDNGDYTINERRAAMAERSRIELVVRDGLSKTLDTTTRRAADNEKPPGTDQARSDRARQATRFTYGLSPNPFTGMMPAELNSILYDESKSYTTNERRAALAELTRLAEGGSSEEEGAQNTTDSLMSQFDPYGSQGAYSVLQMRSVLRAQNTSMFLGLLEAAGNGQSGFTGLLGGNSAGNSGSLSSMLGL